MTFWEYYIWRYANDPTFRRITHAPTCTTLKKGGGACTCEYSHVR